MGKKIEGGAIDEKRAAIGQMEAKLCGKCFGLDQIGIVENPNLGAPFTHWQAEGGGHVFDYVRMGAAIIQKARQQPTNSGVLRMKNAGHDAFEQDGIGSVSLLVAGQMGKRKSGFGLWSCRLRGRASTA